MEGQRKARGALVDERNREAGTPPWQPCRRNAPVWPPTAGRSRPRAAHPLRGGAPRSRHRLREGYPVADRPHGAVLRSAGNRINCGCFSKAMIPAFCPLPTRGRVAGRDRPAVRLHRRFRRGHHQGCEGNGKGDDGLAPGGRQRNHDADRGAFPG
jgi:hypothetical protein